MITGWMICVTVWIAANVAFAAWRIYVTRDKKRITRDERLTAELAQFELYRGRPSQPGL
jgi:hypothetical protein